jgi:N-formylglutamate amidohydrolase
MDYFKIVRPKKIPIVMNIPHASLFVDDDFKQDFLLSVSEFDKFLKEMADLYADELFFESYKKNGVLIAKLSRVIVDTERFWDNKNEPMAKVGMGALYEKNGQGQTIRKISKLTRLRCRRIYSKYHHALDGLVAECLTRFGYCIILDCHTYPSKLRQYDLNKNRKRPEICLGTDKFHTSRLLFDCFKNAFLNRSFSVEENIPFKGTIVPVGYFKKNKNVFSLMVEVNRALYMNERTYMKKKNFKQIAADLNSCVQNGINEFIKKQAKK